VVTGALELFLVLLGLIYFLATTATGLRVLHASSACPESTVLGKRHHAWRVAELLRPVARMLRPLAELLHPLTELPRRALAPLRPARRWLRAGRPATARADELPARVEVVVPPADRVVYFLVPCLNEELVIEETLRSLLADPRARAVVIDDASDDKTAALAEAVEPGRVIVVRRELPDARQGKGPALNAGLVWVLHDAAERGVAASRVIVGVLDADGRLSPGALDAVLPLFDDRRVGRVRLPVRVRNHGSRQAPLEDAAFWGVGAVAEPGRIPSGTVSLGGNGQFTRLRALLEIGSRPWGSGLAGDLDVALALAAAGWRVTSTPRAHVSQQGCASLRTLVSQRTRWYLGHLQAARRLPALWSSRRLSRLGRLEITMSLLVPWLLVLPWSVVFNYNVLLVAGFAAGWARLPALGTDLFWCAVTLGCWYALCCLQVWAAGYFSYRQQRRDPGERRRRGTGFARAFLLDDLLAGNYISYLACWRALGRLVTGARGWDEAARHHHVPGDRLAVLAGLVPVREAEARLPVRVRRATALIRGRQGARRGGRVSRPPAGARRLPLPRGRRRHVGRHRARRSVASMGGLRRGFSGGRPAGTR
jgi:1,2-diacylglycerol 3-beta-glucosyltransferase